MNSRKRNAKNVRALCAQMYDDDGVDPRDDKRIDAGVGGGRGDGKPDRKAMQLCKQAAVALQLALSELPEAGELAGAWVREVVPAPNTGRVRAVVVIDDASRRATVEHVLERSARRLRREVAAAITRRRAPELTFVVEVEHGGERPEPNGGHYV